MNLEPPSNQAHSADSTESRYLLPADELMRRLETDRHDGLSNSAVELARSRYGWNQLTVTAPTPWWRKLLSQFQELLIWILMVAALIAALMGEWIDASAIMAIVLLNGILGFIQEEKAGQALAALKAMSSPMAKIIRGGKLQSLPARDVVPGDIIQIEAGDHVPADARLIESYSLATQEASLTGESMPVFKDASIRLPAPTPVADRVNSVFMGTVITAGRASAVVVATGMKTELGQIADMLIVADPTQTPLQRRLSELGKILIVVCLVLVAVIFSIQFLRGGDLMETVLVAVSLAVASVPEGLPAVVTIALAVGLQRMAKRNALIRKLASVETLGSVTVICSDKTGTLTRNEMTVRELAVGCGAFEISGTGYEPRGDFFRKPEPGHERGAAVDCNVHPDLVQAVEIASICNNARVTSDPTGRNWQVIGDPTEGALQVMAIKSHTELDKDPYKVVMEQPFDSERKMMSVVVRRGEKTVMYTKGAPEVVLAQCTAELRSGRVQGLDHDRTEQIRKHNSKLAGEGLRVLALAFRDHPDFLESHLKESELTFAGLVGMHDPPREEVKTAVAECHRAGIRPLMITGDHPETALAIGRQLNLASAESRAVSGAELDQMSDVELETKVESIPVYARVSAAHKMRVIKAWKARGQVVAMTGDGVNDAPAVQSADIGIAMGITGTDVTKQAADMVLTDDNFASIVSAIREGRAIFDNIQKFVHYLLSCNAGEVLLMFAAALLGMPLPLVAIQILWINLVTDGLPALAIALEPPEPGIMDRKPRAVHEPVITWKRGLLIVYHGILIAAASLFGFWWVYSNQPDNLPLARTVAFAVTAFSQLAFALVCRSQRFTLPQLGLLTNRWLFFAFVGSGILQICVLTLPLSINPFDVVSMPPATWGMVMVLALIPATIIEVAKILFHVIRNKTVNTGS